MAVNKTWNEINIEPWKIDMTGLETTSQKSVQTDYLDHFASDSMGLFLAQQVSFNPIGLNFDANPFGEIQ